MNLAKIKFRDFVYAESENSEIINFEEMKCSILLSDLPHFQNLPQKPGSSVPHIFFGSVHMIGVMMSKFKV